MKDSFDWIVVGAGITGAALAYELSRQGHAVLLIEKDSPLQDATRYSYGGLAHWAGRTPLVQQMGAAGIARYRQLEDELGQSIQFREVDLVMPIPASADPQQVAQSCQDMRIPPQLLSPQEAKELEPLLDVSQLSGALLARHGHIRPELTAAAFADAMVQRGGKLLIGIVSQLRPGSLQAGARTYHAAHIAVCAGAWGRSLLRAAGMPVPLYFTHAELIEVDPQHTAGIRMQTIVTPALLKRMQLEQAATRPTQDPLWDQAAQEWGSAILDVGAVQFRNGSIRIGQISRTVSSMDPVVAPAESEAQIRAGIAQWLPALQDLPGTWRHARVSFSADQLPLVGSLPGTNGRIHLFSGFSNPLAVVPVLAQRYARFVSSAQPEDEIIDQLSLSRFQALAH